MSRSRILVAGAFLWAAVAADLAIHIARGDWLVPAAMAVAGVGFVAVRETRRAVLGAATA